MSKHYRKIIDLIKAEEEESNGYVIRNYADLEKVMTSGEDISEQEYSDIMTDKHDVINAWRINESIGKLLNLSAHNNPQTNSRILKEIHSQPDEDGEFDGAFKHLSARGNLKGEDINKFMDGTYLDNEHTENEIVKNPHLRGQHLEEYADKNPSDISRVIDHPSYDSKILSNLMNKEGFRDGLNYNAIDSIVRRGMKGYNNNGDAIPDQEQSLDLHPNTINQLIEHKGDFATSSSLNVLLDHADPTFKKRWTDSKLGITDGTHGHTLPEEHEGGADSDAFKANNWVNWATGEDTGHDERISRYLAGSRHIDDDQADHVKRHSNIDTKYNLYTNSNIDPKHGAEMFKKWHDDDDHHGYDAAELNEYHKEHRSDKYTIDDLDPSVLEEIKERGHEDGEIREYAEESYDIYEYLRDEEDSIVEKMGNEYDDIDEIHETLYDGHDWEGENPNSSQNVGDPVFDKLDSIHNEYGDSNSHLTLGEAKVGSWDEIGISPESVDDDGDVHIDDIKEKLGEYGGPSQINFADHDEFTIGEHPDYDERYEEAAIDWRTSKLRNDPSEMVDGMYLYEDHQESDGYREAESNAEKDYIEENTKEYMGELFDGSHQDTRFVPSHLHNHIENFSELSTAQRVKNLDGPNKSFLDENMKDRSYDHAYGDNQHHHEMVRDYANVNNGKIDIGTMNKLHPNQKEIWKQIFDGKGKITSDEAEGKLNALPKTNYEISYGKWDQNKMQNLNNRDQVIMRLDHSDESIKPLMEDSELYDTFKRVQDVSQQSGHPTRSNSIAWARVDTSDPNHWMIDEVQSDFGKTVTRYLKQEGNEHKANHIEQISGHHKNWREALTNAVLKEAKKHGAEKVSTHSPESKHSHAAYGASKIHSVYKDSYKKVPRSMGFASVEHDTLPLTDRGRQHFVTENANAAKAVKGHEDAYTHHTEMALSHGKLLGKDDNHAINQQKHTDLANAHGERLKQYNPSVDLDDHVSLGASSASVSDAKEHGNGGTFYSHEHDAALQSEPVDSTPKTNKGHTFNLTPQLLKKNMDDFLELYEVLEKGDKMNALKAGVSVLGLMHGAHYMNQGDAGEKAAKQFSGGGQPAHARSVTNIEHKPDVVEQARIDAKNEGDGIAARNDKKSFLGSHSDGLSPHVYKQTIKSNPDLNEKYNYTNNLSNRTFKEIVRKNPHLKNDVHNAHYDKLHTEFGGDHEKMAHAWSNGVKSTHSKFSVPKEPEAPKMQTKVEEPKQEVAEPNFTHRRARGSR